MRGVTPTDATMLTSDTDRLCFVVANGGHVNKQVEVTHHHRHPCTQTKGKKREERCSAI